MAYTLTVDRHGKAAPQKWRVNAWANVNRSGHGNEFHTHPGCVWSAVYYVDDGGAGESISSMPGSLLMFPSWVSHAVRPYFGDGTRISVAINLS
jgi:hypothetical protein